jgi:hypothetical protein
VLGACCNRSGTERSARQRSDIERTAVAAR